MLQDNFDGYLIVIKYHVIIVLFKIFENRVSDVPTPWMVTSPTQITAISSCQQMTMLKLESDGMPRQSRGVQAMILLNDVVVLNERQRWWQRQKTVNATPQREDVVESFMET